MLFLVCIQLHCCVCAAPPHHLCVPARNQPPIEPGGGDGRFPLNVSVCCFTVMSLMETTSVLWLQFEPAVPRSLPQGYITAAVCPAVTERTLVWQKHSAGSL